MTDSLNNLTGNLNSAWLKNANCTRKTSAATTVHSNRFVECLSAGGIWQNKRFLTFLRSRVLRRINMHSQLLGQHIYLTWLTFIKKNSHRTPLPVALHSNAEDFLKFITNKIIKLGDKFTGPHSSQNESYNKVSNTPSHCPTETNCTIWKHFLPEEL